MDEQFTEIEKPAANTVLAGFETVDGRVVLICSDNRVVTPDLRGRWRCYDKPAPSRSVTLQVALLCVLADHVGEPVDGCALVEAALQIHPLEGDRLTRARERTAKFLKDNAYFVREILAQFGVRESLQRLDGRGPVYQLAGRPLAEDHLERLLDSEADNTAAVTPSWAAEEADRVATGLSEFTSLSALSSLLLVLPLPWPAAKEDCSDAGSAWELVADLELALATASCEARVAASVIEALVFFEPISALPLPVIAWWVRDRIGATLSPTVLGLLAKGDVVGIKRDAEGRLRLEASSGLEEVRSAWGLDPSHVEVRRWLSRCLSSSRLGAETVLPSICEAIQSSWGLGGGGPLKGWQAMEVLKSAAEQDSDQASILYFLAWHTLTDSPHYATAARGEQAVARALLTAAVDRGSTGASAVLALADVLGPSSQRGDAALRLWRAANAEDAATPTPDRWQDYIARGALAIATTKEHMDLGSPSWLHRVLWSGYEAKLPLAALLYTEALFRRGEVSEAEQCLERSMSWTPIAAFDLAVDLYIGRNLRPDLGRAVQLLRSVADAGISIGSQRLWLGEALHLLPARSSDGLAEPAPDDAFAIFSKSLADSDSGRALASAWRMARAGHFAMLPDALRLEDLPEQELSAVSSWLETSADLGESAAATVLAIGIDRGNIKPRKNGNEVLRLLTSAIPTTDVARLLWACHWLLPSEGVPTDISMQQRARHALEDIVELRRAPDIEALLGFALVYGIGGQQDLGRGMSLMEAGGGEPFGANLLGLTLADGPDELRDPVGAVPYLRRAVPVSAAAALVLARLLLEGPDELRDPSEGLRMLELAEARGETAAADLRARVGATDEPGAGSVTASKDENEDRALAGAGLS